MEGHCGRRVVTLVFVGVCLFVCLLATLRKNVRTDLHEIFREGWRWPSEQMFKFWWRSGSPSGYKDCFPDSSLLGYTESGIDRLHCATLQCKACTGRHRRSNYDVIMPPAHNGQPQWTCLGGGMHYPSAFCLALGQMNFQLTLEGGQRKFLRSKSCTQSVPASRFWDQLTTHSKAALIRGSKTPWHQEASGHHRT